MTAWRTTPRSREIKQQIFNLIYLSIILSTVRVLLSTYNNVAVTRIKYILIYYHNTTRGNKK